MSKFNYEAYKAEKEAQIAEAQAVYDDVMSRQPDYKTSTFEERCTWYDERANAEHNLRRLQLLKDPKFVCELCYSDRHAYEVLRMDTERKMVVRQLKAIRTDDRGMSESQDYDFVSDVKQPEVVLRMHKNGRWYATDCCNPFTITEEPYEYYDFSF